MFLIVLFSHPLGMSALIVDGKPLLEPAIDNKLTIPTEIIKQTNEKIEQSLKKYRFNGTALIAIKGEVVYETAKGYANFSTKTPIELESSFQLASASKPFTALSIMMLKERNLLNYDDKVTQFLSDFPYPDVSIRNLLNHTAGLQNYMYLIDNFWSNDKTISNQDVLDLINKHQLPLNHLPGRRFAYSNTGYAILALIVEKITGAPFGTFLQTEIFDKLGMQNSFVYDRKRIEENPNQVIGYNAAGRRLRPFYHDANNEILGDKSVYSTVHDLLKFEQALNNFELVDQSTLEEAYSKAMLLNHNFVNYGFGWRLKEDGARSYIFHNGAWHGFMSTITYEPKTELTLVLLNNTSASISTIKQDLLSILHHQFSPYLAENSDKSLVE